MAAYVIVRVDVTDQERFREYAREVPRVIEQYGGRYMSRGGEVELLEGGDCPSRMVLIEFPSMQKVREWYHSDEYRKIKPLREGAATGSILAVDGLTRGHSS